MPPSSGGTDQGAAGYRRFAVVLVALAMAVSAGAAVAGAQVETPTQSQTEPQPDDGDEEWTTVPEPLSLTNETDANDTEEAAIAETEDLGEQGEAVETAVNETAERLQAQGVTVNQSQRQAAVNGAVAAVEQHQNATVEQVQNATAGALAGTLYQSQNVTVEQVQYAVAGATAGALSQHQTVEASQMQHAAYGAAHGSLAQRQNVTVRQVQTVAQGAAAGAAHEAGKHEDIHPGAIREAAQGGAFGALTQQQNATVVQQQNVTIEQRQTAAAGAAEGALSQHQNASVKQIQTAAIGAAEGALTVEQRQEVTVEQTQAAARGACRGALTQTQRVTVTQIQQAAHGAAQGAVSQSQQASVTQIQAAATGGAAGVVTQVQEVNIVQIQQAAMGAASGAALSAAQNQVVNVEQIQAAAMGAGQGTVIQIQQINIVQIQIIAESAADGALSQHQRANVRQIQSAARGACEGAVAATQRQEVSVEQVQRITRDAASDTAAAAAQVNITNEITIINYARGAAEDPEEDPDDDGAERLRSVFASVDDGTLFLANPNDVAVTVTITSDEGGVEARTAGAAADESLLLSVGAAETQIADGGVETRTLAPGESATVELASGIYTLTAETSDGRDVEIAGRDELTVSVGGAPQSVTTSVEDRTLTVENPNDERVTVALNQEGQVVQTITIPREWERSVTLDPGTYSLTAENEAGESVPVDGEDEAQITVEPQVIDLDASIENDTLTVENPSDSGVRATATPEDGDAVEFDVPAGETATEQLEPGNYTLTAEDDADVLIEGQSEFEFQVPADEEPGPPNASLTVEDQAGNGSVLNVTNASADVEYYVDAHWDGNTAQSDAFSANEAVENLTVALDPPIENDTTVDVAVHAAADDAELASETVEYTVTEDETEPGPAANLTVENQTGNGSVLNVTNATASVPFVIEAVADGTTGTSQEYEADASAENATLDLDPPLENDSTVNVSVVDAANDTELANETIQYTVTEEEAPLPGPTGNLTVEDQAGNGSVLNVTSANASVAFVVEVEADGTTGASDEFAAGEDAENLTLDLVPSLENDSEVNVSVVDAANDTELANETIEYNVTDDEVEPEPTANLTVEDQAGNGSVLNVTSANASVDYVVEAEADGATATSVQFAGGEEAENLTLSLEPPLENDSTVNVSVVDAANDTELANESIQYNVTEEEPVAPGANLTVENQTGNGSVLNVTNATADVEYYVDVHWNGNTVESDTFAAGQAVENLTVALDPPIENDTTVDVAVHAAADDAELANETIQYTVTGGAAEPTATVAFANQTANYTHVTVDSVNLSAGGFVAIHENSTNGTDDVVGNSTYLEPGEYEDLTIELDDPLYENDTLNATVYRDANGDETFDRAAIVDGIVAPADEEGDEPYLNETGDPVTDEAYVTVPNATVGFEDQATDGSQVVVQSANLSDGGFVTVRDAGPDSPDPVGSVIGTSEYLDPGEHENVTVALDQELAANATLYAVAHRDTDADQQANFVATAGEADEPYLNESGEPVVNSSDVTVEQRPEPGVAFENCTAARVTGTYDTVTVTLAYYDTDGFATEERVLTGDALTADRPVDGETLFRVGETPDESVTDDGVRVVTLADPGAFGDDARSYVAMVNASESPAGDPPLSATQPSPEACQDAVRPDAPTLTAESIAVLNNDSAMVTFRVSNPNDAPMEPVESGFTEGTTLVPAPDTLAPGEETLTVEWTPESTDEQLIWTANLSNFGLPNATAETPPAGEVEGLLEPPEATPEPIEPDETPTPEPTTPIEGEDTPTNATDGTGENETA